jgi:putative addiction module component (TIGR02574 family)
MSEEISERLKKCAGPAACSARALAGSLFESLDETVDEGAEAEWQKEIPRRMQELDSGEVKPVAWAEARQQISAILNGR